MFSSCRKHSGKFISKYSVGGSPLRMKGDGRKLTWELLRSKTIGDESFTIHTISGYISTLYLCEYPQREFCPFLLLDAGCKGDFLRISAYLKHLVEKRGGEKRDLNMEMGLVLATHAHCDHFGALSQYRNHSVKVLTARNYEQHYAGWRGELQHFFDSSSAQLFARRLGRQLESLWAPRRIELSPQEKLLQMHDGMALPGYEDWVCIFCPGHTNHMCILYHPETHILYAADFFIAHRGEFRCPLPVNIMWAFSHTIHRLRQLQVRYVLLAHGGIVNVEDAGGWDAILDEVVRHSSKTVSHPTLWLIETCLWGWAPCQLDREQLPRGPLPQGIRQPMPVYHLK